MHRNVHHISDINLTLTNLGNQQRAHAGARAAAERVGHLKALEGVAAFGLATDHVQHLINQLGALGVVALSPVIAGARVSKDEVVGTEKLAKRTGAHRVHRARF